MQQLTIDGCPTAGDNGTLIIEPHRRYRIHDEGVEYTVQVTGIGETKVYGMRIPGGSVVVLEDVQTLARNGQITPLDDAPAEE